jgi:hypothetical protein
MNLQIPVIPPSLLIPVASCASSADRQELASVADATDREARRTAKLARRRELAAIKRLDPDYVARQRAYDRQYYASHKPAIAASQARYQTSAKGRTTRAAREAAAREPINILANKFLSKVPSMTPTTIKSPPKSVSRGRPQFLLDFAKEHHVDLKTLRRISKLIAAKREAERGLAQIEAQLTASVTKEA